MIDKEMEMEANVFAACLLIPEKMIIEDLRQGLDLMDNKAIDNLCKKYQVTQATLLFRISLITSQILNPSI